MICMNKSSARTAICLGVVITSSLCFSPSLQTTLAQSGSRYQSGGRAVYPPSQIYRSQPGRNYQTQPGSTTRTQAGSSNRSGSATQGNNVALSGFCPVCIIDMKQWVRGTSQHLAKYDGKVYYFPNAQIKQTFLENPGKYVPALGGDCTVCLAKMGKRMPGSVYHSAYHKSRLYLFPGEEQKQMFVANPAQFANVDLAMNGMCSVCKVEMGQDVQGVPEHAAYHNGMRYLFPGKDQLKMFHANPQKYTTPIAAPAPGIPGVPTSSLPARNDSATAAAMREVVTVVGTSTCAGCEHGVTPIGSPETLGLGVETEDCKLVVVEEAHDRYPDVYKGRFKKLQLEVSGTVVKTEGQICWLQPTELRVIN